MYDMEQCEVSENWQIA